MACLLNLWYEMLTLCDMLTCGKSMRSRNIYKDTLNDKVSLIDHVVTNHQNQTRINDI
jgi:intracellular sulfur oxidation DsrE/DsrF family protein